ncbi:hypothetical protein LCGC14_1250140 [marine sediment metagenome]|uniref:Uncharacterized protein n=1 Tax=marine sediment metagenome TaxID=412755 RepID=A0A0F9NKJ2_9ZZZZ
MINKEDKIWEILDEYKISKISFHYLTDIPIYNEDTDTEDYTDGYVIEFGKLKSGESWRYYTFSKHFGHFNININRAMVFYYDLIIKNRGNEFDLKYLILTQNFFILLINSLEVYLIDIFKSLAKGLKVEILNMELFVKFLGKFNLKNEFYNTLKEEGNIGFYLSEILPERLDLLQKDKCRIAYQLVNFDLFNIDKEGWEKNFCNRNGNCYIQQRHEIVHGGLPIIHEKTKSSQLEFIETALIDIVKFVLSIEDSTYQRISELEKKELEESSK